MAKPSEARLLARSITDAIRVSVLAEREACAKIAESHIEDMGGPTDTGRIWRTQIASRIMTAIRART